MYRYFLKLQYDGASFHGWQRQNNANSVQEEVEKALFTFFRVNVSVVGCGRTDTGVHATEYYAHFDLDREVDLPQTKYKLNSILPHSISILEVQKVSAHAHARFDAKVRGYEYFIHQEKNPFIHNRSWYIRENLDVDLMNKGCEILKQNTDFAAFCKAGSDNKTTNCVIKEMIFVESKKNLIFNVLSDRFLRNMVRALVGTLVEVGKGKISLEDLEEIIKSKDRSMAGTSAPGHALFLSKVEYDSIIFAD